MSSWGGGGEALISAPPFPILDLLQSDHHVNSIHNESLRQLEFSRQSEGSSMGDSVTALIEA